MMLSMETVACDLCGSDKIERRLEQTDLLHHITTERFTVVCCRACHLLYLNPRPSSGEVARYYPKTYYAHARSSVLRDALRSVLRGLVNMAAVGKRSAVVRFFANAVLFPVRVLGLGNRLPNLVVPEVNSFIDVDSPAKILDVGCGAGQEVHVFGPRVGIANLVKRGWEVCAVEASSRAREVLNASGIKDAFENFEEAKFPSDSFDVVRLSWSLEHVPSPTKMLNECKRVLKPGGRLIVAIPNYGGLIYKIFPTCLEVPVHTYYFTLETFKKYCEKLTLTIVDYYTFSHVPLVVEALKMMGRKDLHEHYLAHSREALRLQAFLDLAGETDMGDDMVFCLTKE
ncbi:MAG: hypothetical protein COB53_03225 [Elusimicrobia bacterium]|nr:MAG: hypothetical protein COB53_03225 [Elusimicrobiota bacterium]